MGWLHIHIDVFLVILILITLIIIIFVKDDYVIHTSSNNDLDNKHYYISVDLFTFI